MHFGLYLYRKSVITAEQLLDAVESQHDNLVPIGQLALEEGILAPRDVFTVLRLQSDLPGERFGDVAIELGLMTDDQLMRLLMIQTDRKRSLSEILVKQGAIDRERARDELAEFRRDRLRSARPVKKTIIRAPKTRLTPAAGRTPVVIAN